MLKLTLRKEFQGRRLKGTAIELANSSNTGATQIAASEFLDITYPSADALKAVEAVGPSEGRPLVLIGERGQGKSHLLGMLYHAFTDASATHEWLNTWAERLGNSKLAELPLRDSMHVISESLHRQSYKFLWDLVFERHPHGSYIQGKWEGLGDKQPNVPSYDLLLELFQHTPTALVLDEFQTWYDGLTNTKQHPRRNWAFNFIQLLSEIAKEHPELLVLVVSVRNGSSDAFQQIQRVEPILVDFKGPTAKQDRQKLLLHRLFENRMQVSDSQIESTINAHVTEYLRLLQVAPSEHDQVQREFVDCWPYAPHLMQLLEDQVLVATQAQETRDLIRILADLFKRHEDSPVLTAADFRLDDEKSGIAALLDSVSNQHHANLREKAQRNLSAVLDAVKNPDSVVPHLAEIVGSLWLRSLAVGNMAGTEPEALQADITRGKPIDDNGFQVELSTIVENSFNIHQDGNRLVFREEENPQAKLIASARNDKLFKDGADHEQLAKEVRYVISGQEDVSKAYRVVVLSSNWTSEPWPATDDNDNPQNWDERLPLLVLPSNPEKNGATLGPWLKDHLQKRRNAVRFLLPRNESTNIFHDRDLLILSRAVVLAERWKTQGPEYRKLLVKYERDLRDILKKRFDRFAILDTWNFQEPTKCTFHVEAHKAEGAKIPDVIDEHIRTNLFIPEDFEELVLAAADNNVSVGKLLRELQEPRPSGDSCIPWLGETPMKERIIRICARGDIAINVRGMEYLQVQAGEDEETAWKRMRGKLGTGKHLDETYVLKPQAVPHTEGVSKPEPQPEPNGGLFGDNSGGDQPGGNDVDAIGGTPPTAPVAGGIFGGGVDLTPHASGATSALNLLGEIESWGIGTGTQVQEMSLKVSSLTGAQLNKLLRSLPDGITYELSLNKEKK
jgi:hypothetical protein